MSESNKITLRKAFTADLADKLAEILAENFKRGPLDYLYTDRKRDLVHLRLAAQRVEYTIKPEDTMLVLSAVNRSLEAYWAATKPTKGGAIDMRHKNYREQKHVHYEE